MCIGDGEFGKAPSTLAGAQLPQGRAGPSELGFIQLRPALDNGPGPSRIRAGFTESLGMVAYSAGQTRLRAGLIRVDVPANTSMILRPVLQDPTKEYTAYKRVQ